MKLTTALLAVIAAASLTVQAGHLPSLSSRSFHNNLAIRAPPARNRCRHRDSKPSPQPKSKNTGGSSSKSSSSGGNAGPPKQNNGIIHVQSNCGDPRATARTTRLSGPNGHIDWLNCGIENGGWRPPNLHVNDLVVVSLSEAIQKPGSPFMACARFFTFFNRYGNQFGIQPILLASFALQESSCRPETVGQGGEQGLMQITRDKCGGAPGGNCRDPDFNIRTAARYFARTLADNNGNILAAVGTYNGWTRGLTVGKATAARHSACCRCQNNLDYLQQYFNGWCQGINAYDANHRLGKYFNLDPCGQ